MSLRIRTAPFVVRRASSLLARGSSRKGLKRGFTLVELLVVISIIGMLMAMLLPAIQQARETGFQNTCRNNLSNLAKAVFSYANRNGGRLPGYMNMLKTKKGLPYKDPITQVVTPVSWTVEILSDIDRQSLYEQWQKDLTDPNSGGSSGGSGGGTGSQQNFLVSTQLYIDLLICPSDPATQKSGTPISYVVNTGQRDMVSATPAQAASGSGGSQTSATKGMPRDWQSNGMFFDNFSDDQLIKTTATQRGPMVFMRMELCRDPKDKTILLTENVDAGNYTFDSNGPGGTTFSTAEVEVGSIYSPGPVTNPNGTPPTMDPVATNSSGGGGSGGGGGGGTTASSDIDNLRLNSNIGQGDQVDYNFCRPSSRHPQLINVAYVGQNVQSLKDNIQYFVFAKLMSSDDGQMKLPGTNTLCDPVLRQYQLNDSDINP
ncbi:MAG: DUF1559 domain-containing protein [Planctomycetes bacterium]|nr:DUF1559 domain-containing protein [Planctomycetota bacterium]